MSEFTFVQIPSNDSQSLQLISKSKSGGLEADQLQLFAKAHFKSELDGEVRLDDAKRQLHESGKDVSDLDPKVFENIRNMGVSIEIISLQIARKENLFIGRTMYCDANGIAKGYTPNSRATALVRACGSVNTVVYGDAFLGKCYDNEDEEWIRLSLTLNEADPSADWVKQCAIENAGKDMNKYSSSGSMQANMNALLNKQQSNNSNALITNHGNNNNTSSEIEISSSENLSWNQTSEEVEIHLKIPAEVTAKSIVVTINPNTLKVVLPKSNPSISSEVGIIGEDETKLYSSSGAELYSKVNVSDSTWCIEGTGIKKVLTITLAKPNSINWSTLFK